MQARLIRGAELAATIVQAGVDPTFEGRALQDAVLSGIADRQGYISWDVDHAGRVVMQQHPKEETFHGRTLEGALSWCLEWVLAPEIGFGQVLG